MIRVTGGTTPYQFNWSNGTSQPEVVNLNAGIHSVTITDANGCTVTAETIITEDILPLQVKAVETSRILCAGQNTAAIDLTISGGKSPYDITWGDGSNAPSRQLLQAGEYTVDVTDAADQKTSVVFSVSEPEPLTGAMIDVRAATHERIQDGKATAQVRGGNTPYTFAWDNQESGARAMKLSVGMHVVTVTDANGCTLRLETEIVPKLLPELTAENLEKGEAVRMEQLQFQADSSAIDPSSVPTLEELYAFLYDNPTIVVEIGGHTNGLPEHDYCDRLSAARAKAVADYIVDKGIDAKRIVFKGYGKRQPIATNMTPEGRKRNQRVEVRIVKLSE
jgi:outer membrane protein OmpA-like peptidoglycan-associated protein